MVCIGVAVFVVHFGVGCFWPRVAGFSDSLAPVCVCSVPWVMPEGVGALVWWGWRLSGVVVAFLVLACVGVLLQRVLGSVAVLSVFLWGLLSSVFDVALTWLVCVGSWSVGFYLFSISSVRVPGVMVAVCGRRVLVCGSLVCVCGLLGSAWSGGVGFLLVSVAPVCISRVLRAPCWCVGRWLDVCFVCLAAGRRVVRMHLPCLRGSGRVGDVFVLACVVLVGSVLS